MHPRTLLVGALLGLGACTSEIDDKPAADVKAPPAAAPAAAPSPAPSPAPAPAAAAATPGAALKLSPDSQIAWVGAKVTRDHLGGFKGLQGEASVEGGALTGGKVVIDLASLFSDSEKLTGHLKDADFFDVATYPSATFTITGVSPDEGGKHTVTGTLDLHGVQKEISFPAEVQVGEAGATVAAAFTLNRQDFGMAYPGKPDDLIRDDVLVKGKLVFQP